MSKMTVIISALFLTGVGIYILHQIFPDQIDISLIITLWLVEVPLAFVLNYFLKEKSVYNKPQKIITETRADQRKDLEEYSEHLKRDFLSLIESEMKKNNNSSYYNAIKKLKTNKKTLLQHLYTYEKAGIMSPPIYTRYLESRTTDGKLERADMKISRLTSDIYSKAIVEFKKSNDFWTIDTDLLMKKIGIPKIDNFDKSFDLDGIHPKPSSKIYEDSFSYEQDPHFTLSKWYIVKYDDEVVAKTASKKIAKKLVKLLPKQCSDISDKVIELLDKKIRNEKYIKTAVHTMFKEITESLKIGKPNLGVCDACVGFFPFERKTRYQQYLYEFNSTPWSWSDDIWN